MSIIAKYLMLNINNLNFRKYYANTIRINLNHIMKKSHFYTIIIMFICLSSHAEIVLDGTLGINKSLEGDNYLIQADYGQQRGGNLFHSFSDFNLQSHEQATFFGPNTINNIISRVTGGNPSNIDGLIRSEIPNANLYFLNPNGIIFGPNAQLDISGSFHASTADYLRLGNEGRFDVRNPDNSILTIAPVEAFGFLNSQIAPISLTGHGEINQTDSVNGLRILNGKNLSLIGNDINVKNSAFLSVPTGQINLVSVASPGEVIKDKDGFLDMSMFKTLGNINITEQSKIETSGEGAGSIFIRGGRFVVEDSFIVAKTIGNKDGGIINIQVNDLLVKGFNNNSIIDTTTKLAGKGADLKIRAQTVEFLGDNQSLVELNASTFNSGKGGDILIIADNVNFKNGGKISNFSEGNGKTGNITIKATGSINFSGTNEKGDTSAIYYESKGGSFLSENKEFSKESGKLSMTAKNITFENQADIFTVTWGNGNGGNIALNAEETVTISGGAGIFASSIGKENAIGNAGNVSIKAKNILLIDGGWINSNTKTRGNAGKITLEADNSIKFSGNFKLGVEDDPSPYIHAGDASKIYTSTLSEKEEAGNAGEISIITKNLSFKDGGGINAETMGIGDGNLITIKSSNNIEFIGVNPHGENKYGFGSGIYATSQEKGNAGNIYIEADSLLIKDGALITNSTLGNGQGGDIALKIAGNVVIKGSNLKNDFNNDYLESQIAFQSENSNWSKEESISGIYASSENKYGSSGKAGQITLDADTLIISDNGKISSSSVGEGDAGHIIIIVNKLQLDDNASIASESKLSNKHTSANITELENNTLPTGGIVKVQSIGKQGKIGYYLNTGEALTKLTQTYTVTDMAARDNLASIYNLADGDIVEVKKNNDGKPARFIYASESVYGINEWVKFSDKATIVLSNLEQLDKKDKIETPSWSNVIPYESGTIIKVENVSNNKPATFVYTVVKNSRGWSRGRAIRINQFTAENSHTALESLKTENALQNGALATVNKTNQKFVYLQEQGWLKFNPTNSDNTVVDNMTEMNALPLAKIGDIAELENKTYLIYTGQDVQKWIAFKKTHSISNIAELDKIQAKNGDLAKLAADKNGKFKNFFYLNGKWVAQTRGGEAGKITINARENILLINNSSITTEASSAGGGGMVLEANKLLRIANSKITTSVQESTGKGGNMAVKSEFIILKNGKIFAKAHEGKGGKIDITTTGIYDFLYEPDKSVSASSEKGIDGEIAISLPDTDIGGQLISLPKEFVNADNQLKSPCSFRLSENISSFRIIASEGTANEIEDLLPSGLILSKLKPATFSTNSNNFLKANMSGGCTNAIKLRIKR